MPDITRRAMIAGGAALLSTPASAAPANSAKANFMKTAINNIALEAAPRATAAYEFREICIPVPFADWDFFYTKGTLWWVPKPGQPFREVIVPEGFCTDLASVPQAFWSFFPKTGRYAYAAIVHDYLYWTQEGKREDADAIFTVAMRDAGVGSATITAFSWMVRAFGSSAWSQNLRAKAAGQKRFLKVLPPTTELISWADWQSDPSRFSD